MNSILLNLQNIASLFCKNPQKVSFVRRDDGDFDATVQFNEKRDWRPCEKKPILLSSDWFFPFFQTAVVTDSMLKAVLRRQISKISKLERKTADGKLSYFSSHTNGSDVYFREKRARQICAAKTFVEEFPNVFFLTLTYDKNGSKKDRLAAWESYGEEIVPLLTALRKAFGCRFQWVIEATAKGFPHAHVVLYFPPGVFPELEKLRPKTFIKFGRLKEFIKARVKAPVFYLEKGDAKKALGYILKYMGKTQENDFQKLLSSEKEWTKSQRKDVLSFVMPIIAGIRRFGYSETREIAMRMKMYTEEKEFMENYRENTNDWSDSIGESVGAKDFVPDPDPLTNVYGVKKWCEILSAPALRERVLIKLCTNMAVDMTKSIRAVSLADFELELLKGQNETEMLPSEIREYFNARSHTIYGLSPIIQRFLDLDGLACSQSFETPYTDFALLIPSGNRRKIRGLEKWAAAHWTPFDYEFEQFCAPPEMVGDYEKMRVFSKYQTSRRKKSRHFHLSMPERLDHLLVLEKLAAAPNASYNQKMHAFLWRQDFERRKKYLSETYIHACLDGE